LTAVGALVLLERQPASSTASTVTAAGPSTAESPRFGEPVLVATGDDIEPVIRSFVAYQAWLLEHPDPASVDKLYEPTAKSGRRLKVAMEGLVSRGQRFDCGAGPEVVFVEASADPAKQTSVRDVVVHLRRPDCRLLNASGAQLGIQPGYDRTAFAYSLQNSGGRWYVRTERNLGDASR